MIILDLWLQRRRDDQTLEDYRLQALEEFDRLLERHIFTTESVRSDPAWTPLRTTKTGGEQP